MALIQFTRNHTDHSTDKGYQFEFFCDRCGNGYMSEYKASATGFASSALRAAGGLFGGILGSAASESYEIERAIAGPAHDRAYREAIEESKPNFRQCPRCSHWVCLGTCWNQKRSLCYECAPDLDTELASAQVQTTVQQMKEKLAQQDLTKDLNLTAEATALCPSCGARTQGAKFCPECGKPLRPKNECGKCGTMFEAGAKFCPECGNKVI
ncbi:MAG: zinc ribbon domain-containing protein [Acidobacteriales bacterium]|nr:zinc ribbon domain-containing protein [Terriglobales bacterium]